MTTDTHWLRPWLFSCMSLCLFKRMSATGYQSLQTHMMKLNWAWAAIKPHLQYQHSILQIIHSLLWILQVIRALLGDWGKWLNLGLSDALTGSHAFIPWPCHPTFLQSSLLHRITSWDQNVPTKSQRSHQQIDPGAGWGGGSLSFGAVELGRNVSPMPRFILV